MSPAISPETSPHTSENGVTVRVLPGQAALTSFEAERLADKLRALDAGVRSVDAHYLYLLAEPEGAKPLDEERLAELLETGEEVPARQGVREIWIAPRTGTQSPWSSKATDILHNTGFESVLRLERARVVRIEGASDVRALAGALRRCSRSRRPRRRGWY